MSIFIKAGVSFRRLKREMLKIIEKISCILNFCKMNFVLQLSVVVVEFETNL